MPKATSVKEYRERSSKVEEITLPSGAVFKVRRLTPFDFVSRGLKDIPNEFLEFLKLPAENLVKEVKEKEEFANTIEQMIRIAVEVGIVEPQITLKYEEDKKETHLVFAELEAKDQAALLDFILGGNQPRQMSPFFRG